MGEEPNHMTARKPGLSTLQNSDILVSQNFAIFLPTELSLAPKNGSFIFVY